MARADLGLNIGFCCHLICAGVIGTPVCWRGIEVGGGDVVGGDGNSNGSGLADGYGGNVRWERCSMITDYNVTTVWMSQCRTMKLRKQYKGSPLQYIHVFKGSSHPFHGTLILLSRCYSLLAND